MCFHASCKKRRERSTVPSATSPGSLLDLCGSCPFTFFIFILPIRIGRVWTWEMSARCHPVFSSPSSKSRQSSLTPDSTVALSRHACILPVQCSFDSSPSVLLPRYCNIQGLIFLYSLPSSRNVDDASVKVCTSTAPASLDDHDTVALKRRIDKYFQIPPLARLKLKMVNERQKTQKPKSQIQYCTNRQCCE